MRVLAIADELSPFIYTDSFPNNLPPFDLVLSAGDMPGHVLEFIAIARKQLEATKSIVNFVTEEAVWVRVMFDYRFDLIPEWLNAVEVRRIRDRGSKRQPNGPSNA